MRQHIRRLFSLLIKAAISALLLYVSLRWVDTGALGERFNRIEPAWLALVILVVIAQVGILGLRWRQIAIGAGAPLATIDAVRFSLIATFFNQTLPSTIGGDAARVWMLARHSGSWKSATYSVLIDRVVGLFALAVIVLACLPMTLELVRDRTAQIMLVAIGLAGIGGPIGFVALGFLPDAWLNRFWATRHLAAAARSTWRVFAMPRTGLLVALLSFAIHALTVTAAWAAAKSVSAPFEFLTALSVVPPVILVATIPISIAGWGVRESAMIAAFSYAGLAQTDGLLVSIIFGAATFVVGILGGLTWIVSGEKVAAKARSD